MNEDNVILIVDDNLLHLKTLSRLLANQKYTVINARTGLEAVSLVKATPPDLIILDYVMPDGDGVYVITMLRSMLETFTIPVIFLTAHSSRQLRKTVFALSAAYVLEKPYDRNCLLEKVREIIGGKNESGRERV